MWLFKVAYHGERFYLTRPHSNRLLVDYMSVTVKIRWNHRLFGNTGINMANFKSTPEKYLDLLNKANLVAKIKFLKKAGIE